MAAAVQRERNVVDEIKRLAKSKAAYCVVCLAEDAKLVRSEAVAAMAKTLGLDCLPVAVSGRGRVCVCVWCEAAARRCNALITALTAADMAHRAATTDTATAAKYGRLRVRGRDISSDMWCCRPPRPRRTEVLCVDNEGMRSVSGGAPWHQVVAPPGAAVEGAPPPLTARPLTQLAPKPPQPQPSTAQPQLPQWQENMELIVLDDEDSCDAPTPTPISANPNPHPSAHPNPQPQPVMLVATNGAQIPQNNMAAGGVFLINGHSSFSNFVVLGGSNTVNLSNQTVNLSNQTVNLSNQTVNPSSQRVSQSSQPVNPSSQAINPANGVIITSKDAFDSTDPDNIRNILQEAVTVMQNTPSNYLNVKSVAKPKLVDPVVAERGIQTGDKPKPLQRPVYVFHRNDVYKGVSVDGSLPKRVRAIERNETPMCVVSNIVSKAESPPLVKVNDSGGVSLEPVGDKVVKYPLPNGESTDWEDKIPMDVISFMDATDPMAEASNFITPDNYRK